MILTLTLLNQVVEQKLQIKILCYIQLCINSIKIKPANFYNLIYKIKKKA